MDGSVLEMSTHPNRLCSGLGHPLSDIHVDKDLLEYVESLHLSQTESSSPKSMDPGAYSKALFSKF
jgi:hypothetical protein